MLDPASDVSIQKLLSSQLADSSKSQDPALRGASQLWLTLESPEELNSHQASGSTLQHPRDPMRKTLETHL